MPMPFIADQPVSQSTAQENAQAEVISYRVPFWQRNTTLPILCGPLTGSWWLPASGGKIVRLICGTYEREQTRLFQENIKADSVVFDLGANVGYYTLLAAKLARRGQVVAFEPEPKNAAFLRATVAANRCRNVAMHEVAVSAVAGTARFQFGRGTGTGKLSGEGTLEVKTITLDEFVSSSGLKPTHLKIDVEGGEMEVFRGGAKTLASHRPTIFLSTHGDEVHAECCELLQKLNYRLQPIGATNLTEATELLCVG